MFDDASSESDVETSSELNFADLGLNPALLEAIVSSGYTIATPIQARAIPPLLEGRDVLGQAQTGTGKTAAFAVPLLQRIDLAQVRPQVLVLTPTRELAIQVAEAFERYASGLNGLRVTAIYGGQDYHVQFRDLDRGVHVIVGTPGRVMDHMRRGSLKLDSIQALVLDEADEMLRMGFAEDVDWVLSEAPKQRQIALFSATMPDAIRRIAQTHLRNPVEITIQQGASAAETVRQRYLVVPPPQKQQALTRILEAEPTDGVIIFVKTKNTTEYLADYLNERGYRTAALSSDVAQKQRERIVENLRANRIDIIVATDVAARGLDVQRISHVINYDFPFDGETYVHRIGRTGRAGRDGDAILILNTRERHMLRRIERTTGQPIEPMEVPSKRAINQRRVSRFHDRITAGLTRSDIETFTSLVNQYHQENPETPMELVAASLAGMAAGEASFLLKDDFTPAAFRESKQGRDDSRPQFSERPRFNDRPQFSERPRFAERPAFAERNRFEDRPPRMDRREERGPRPSRSDESMETFRLEVGRTHGVKPGNIVGAIANEIGVDSSTIGRIEIFDNHSHVDMLSGLPDGMFQALQHVVVAGQSLKISRSGGGNGGGSESAPVANVDVGVPASEGNAPAPRFDRPTKRRFEKPTGRFASKPKFGDAEHKAKKYAPKRSADKPAFGDKPPFAEKPAFGDKPKFSEKPKFGDKPKFGKPKFGDKPKFSAKPKWAKPNDKLKTKSKPKPLKRTAVKSKTKT